MNDRLLQRFRESFRAHQEILMLDEYFDSPVWAVLGSMPKTYKDFEGTEILECAKKILGTKKGFSACFKKIFACLKKIQKNKNLEYFLCSPNMYGLCYPLMVDGTVFGFLVLCGLKKPLAADLKKVFIAYITNLIEINQKEIELEDLNKTIRPRAVALSTVHTVHRLISSTYALNELFPKIARLALQIIRANRCSIKVVDRQHKILLPKVTIDLRKEKTKLKKVKIGKYAPGQAVKKMAPVRSNQYLAVPLIDEDVIGVITLYDKFENGGFTQFDEEIMKTLAEQSVVAIKNAQLFKQQSDLTFGSIRCIARLLEYSPHGVHRTEASFLKLIGIIAPRFRLNENEIKMLQYAAMLHDAGKIVIPEHVIMKRSGLTGREYEMVKMHTVQGSTILSKFKPLKAIVPIIRYQHENFDGTGYPKGLKGKEIPIAARILAVISAFEAMITERPYRKALSINTAIKEIRKNSGGEFDPSVVDVFCEAVRRKDIRKLLRKEIRSVKKYYEASFAKKAGRK